MKIEIGNRGLRNSYQAPFPETVECTDCHGTAKPAVSIMEEDGGVSDTRKEWEDDESGAMWPHDATAFTIYLCVKCLKPTTLFNQA